LWKPHFIEDIKKQAQRTNFDLHHTVFLDYFSDKGIDHDGGQLPIPDFHIHAANRKFGQVTAEVLMITCAAEDALYFKKILTTMAEQEKLNTGKFIPSGLHLVAGPAIVTNLLKNHNFYVDKLTAVAIEGIPMEAMIAEEHFVSEKRIKGTLMEKIYADVPGIISIEKTSSTEKTGKWFVVIKKTNVTSFQTYLDNTLSYAFQGRESMLSEGFQAPKRAGANRSSEVLGTYAEMLKASVRPMATHDLKEKYNQPNRKAPKRTHYNLLDQSSFPSMKNKAVETPDTQLNRNQGTNQHQEQSIQHKEINLKEMEKNMEMAIEKKLMKKLDDMKQTLVEEMDTRITSMVGVIEVNITTMLETSLHGLATSMEQSITKQVQGFMDTFTANLNGKTLTQSTQGTQHLARTENRIFSQTHKQGSGDLHNATSINPISEEDAMKE